MRTIPHVSCRQMLSASGLALATALVAAGPSLRAQSFNATPTTTFGSVNVFATLSSTEVTVSSPSAVINWTPNDTATTGGPIIFQGSGTTATFTNSISGPANFAVLNRIVPVGSTRPIQFDGTVVSRLQSAAGGTVPGGTVFFYSPGGILVGASSVFDVGNLVLTTSDLSYDASGNFDTGGSYVFQPATVPGAQIVVSAGAQLGSSTDGSYIALVAPSIDNLGTIDVNGAAALVAADAATITFSPSGLFDIQVTSGTSATGTVLRNRGAIGGPAATASFHRVYMVAVPKNDAITMALGFGSSLGFDIAGAANVVGNTIVLSAGQDIVGGDVQFGPSFGGGSGTASIQGTDFDATSNMLASATGSVSFNSISPTAIDFASDVTIRAGGNSELYAGEGVIRIGGNLDFSVDVLGNSSGGAVSAPRAEISAVAGGLVDVTGNVRLSANAFGGPTLAVGTAGGGGQGGTAGVTALNGGAVNVGGDLLMQATGTGGGAQVGGAAGGDGLGGTTFVLASGAGGPGASNVTVGGSLGLEASGIGNDGTGCLSCISEGGLGQGGTVSIRASDGGVIGVAASVSAAANGVGGNGVSGGGGAGQGGAVFMAVENGGFISLGATNLQASGIGGAGPMQGGNGVGGGITVQAFGTGGGGIAISEALNMTANGGGGFAGDAAGIGGSAAGGSILVSARDEKFIGIDGVLRASSSATTDGGHAGAGAATGGLATINATDAGVVSVSQALEVVANASGGAAYGSATAGGATGGIAHVISDNGRIEVFGPSLVTANAAGGSQFDGGAGGAGQGGTARISAFNTGELAFTGDMTVAATGSGGDGIGISAGFGGQGRGGFAILELDNANFTNLASLDLTARGSGGVGTNVGGFGEGGVASLSAISSSFEVQGLSYVGAIGSGGSGGYYLTAGQAGGARGGAISIAATSSLISLGTNPVLIADSPSLIAESTAFGGFGTTSASAQGGQVSIVVNASQMVSPGEISLLAEGRGGNGDMSNGGAGGAGLGGTIHVAVNGDVRGPSVISADMLNLSVKGTGGSGVSSSVGGQGTGPVVGNGGAGAGGIITLDSAPDGGLISVRLLGLAADGTGGIGATGFSAGEAGGSGGAATGGQIAIGSQRGTSSATTGGFDLVTALVTANAVGGSGGAGGTGVPAGTPGSGGNAQGGSVTLRLDAGGSTFAASDALVVRAEASGGFAGDCLTACTVTPGSATGGSIWIGSDGLTTGNQINVGSMELSASALGGDSDSSNAGAATGGSVIARMGNGMTFNASVVDMTAYGAGGEVFGAEIPGLSGGDGQGGNVQFIASAGSTATISDSVLIGAGGNGGDSSGPGGIGATGTGGTARLYSDGGAISVNGSVEVNANGLGGAGYASGPNGSGGNGIGGTALLTVGTPTLLGNTGQIDIAGVVNLVADGRGGQGYRAGEGAGGFVGLSARQGNLLLDSVTVSSVGRGGSATLNGIGGSAAGGTIEVFANSATEGGANVEIGSLLADGSALGGAGGDDVSQGFAGAGGNAEGGSVAIFGAAGNGRMQIASLVARADGTGGAGGQTGSGTGGQGGSAKGGFTQVGVASGLATGTTNSGAARYGTITASSSATGGAGGSATLSGGVGGNGGNADAGGAGIVVRGATVNIDGAASLAANATGGAGGIGSQAGSGGAAAIGNASFTGDAANLNLLVTNRFGQPEQGGTLVADALTFTARAIGGSGASQGASTISGRAVDFTITNSSLTAATLEFDVQAANLITGGQADVMSGVGGQAAITGAFRLQTSNAFSLTLDRTQVTADTIAIEAGNWVLAGPAPTQRGSLNGTSSLNLASGLDLVGHADLTSGGAISLFASGSIGFGAISSLGAIGVSAGTTVTLTDLSSRDRIDILAGADIATGAATATGPVSIRTAGNVVTGRITSGSGTPSASGTGNIAINAGGNVLAGDLVSATDVIVVANGAVGTGMITSYDALVLGHGNIALAGLNLMNQGVIADSSMSAAPSGPNQPGFPGGVPKDQILAATPVATAGSVAIAGNASAGSLRIAAGTTVSTAGVLANGVLDIRANGDMTLGNLRSVDGGIQLATSGGTLSIGSVSAALDLGINGSVGLQLGDLSARKIALRSAGSISMANANAGASGIDIAAGTNLRAGNLVSTGDVVAVAGGNIGAGAVQGGDVLLLGGNNTTITGLSARNRALIANASMAGANASKDLILAAAPVATTGAVNIEGSARTGTLRIAAGTSVSTGNVLSDGAIGVTSNGNGSFGQLASTGANIELISQSGALAAQGIEASGAVLARASTGLDIGTANGLDLALLSGGNIVVGSAGAGVVRDSTSGAVTGATGRLLLGNATMAPTTTVPGAVDYNSIFTASTVGAGGTVTISGTAIARRIVSSSAGAMSGASLTGYESIAVSSRAGVRVAQRWFAPSVRIAGADLQIVDNGAGTLQTSHQVLSGIRTTANGEVQIISTSTAPMLVGDGLSGTGFALSNAEIGQISTGRLIIAAGDNPANAIDMLIGRVDLTAGGAVGASNLAGAASRVIFATGNTATQVPAGAIRVTGAINGTGFAVGNVVEFATGRFEMDAATGSIALTSTGTALGGTVEISAANIHVAAPDILSRLVANPLYADRIADLNAPAAVQRPEGVLRALGLELYPTGTLYIQNTGTVLNPAGFLSDFGLTEVSGPTNAAPGSISLIVNGAFQTPTGIVSGVSAHDLAVAQADELAMFSADSQINGCLLSASVCASPMQGADVIGAISGQIQVVMQDPIGTTPPLSQQAAQAIEENDQDEQSDVQPRDAEADAGPSSPIVPPVQLVDSSRLEQQMQIDQPVAGSGNPAFTGSLGSDVDPAGESQ